MSASLSQTPPRPEVLAVANLPPFLMDALQAAFIVHQRLNETDPAAFALAAPITSEGVVLSQPISSTTPSIG